MENISDLLIIGGGPAGAAAAVYAARKRLKGVFLTREWGGQSVVSPEIQNWIGTPSISGEALAASMRTHVEAYADDILSIVHPAEVVGLVATDAYVEATIKDGHTFRARAAFLAPGSSRRKLEVPGAKEFEMKGITYCASCDGPMFSGLDVCVIGGGNSAFGTALQLSEYCKNVTVIVRTKPRAEEISLEIAQKKENIHVITDVELLSVTGNKMVNSITYRIGTGAEITLPVSGVFVEIGSMPNTSWLTNTITLNDSKQVVVDPRTQRTSHPRIWAAGDCTDGLFQQNNIAVGDAVKALEDLYLALNRGM